jgi:hypothetical protein
VPLPHPPEFTACSLMLFLFWLMLCQKPSRIDGLVRLLVERGARWKTSVMPHLTVLQDHMNEWGPWVVELVYLVCWLLFYYHALW